MKAFGLLFCIFCLLTMKSLAQLPSYSMVDWATAKFYKSIMCNDWSIIFFLLFLESSIFTSICMYVNKSLFKLNTRCFSRN